MTNDRPDPAPSGSPASGGALFAAALGRLTSIFRWFSGWRRYLMIFGLDAAAIGLAFYMGFLIRFEGEIPAEYRAQYLTYLPPLLAIRLLCHAAFGIHRWSYRFSGLYEATRVIATSAVGSAAFITVFYFLERGGPPRSVAAIELLLTTSLLGALRFSPRFAHHWFLTQVRSRHAARRRAIIVGAGNAGELLLRDLSRSEAHPYEVVGFADDDPAKQGTTIGGRPVLGPLSELPLLARRKEVDELLFAIPRLPASRIRETLSACAELKLDYKILPVSFAYLKDRVPLAMLQQLAPEDLLHRSPVVFDEREMRRLLEGRKILVTGAGGSIGSEIGRQVAAYGPARLVLADINENELYLLYRLLRERHPDLDVRAEVVDIRDAARVRQLGDEHGFEDVFHAAAHKHVPLMEEAPEEAIKNNVTGCRIVAEMSHAKRVERFVLISTDKAVDPTSVMGASKRIAELVVRDLARRSETAFTAVRFGNVLGSAGSVVPLFKAQIARGGPVTVTDPECRRYIMTTSEAVGLVILAGLGGYGDLCILEMGEPIRILDLARLMVTLAGYAPEREMPIVYTGLRPGEKLEERLMSEEEERGSRSHRHMIRVVTTPPPQPELVAAIGRLEQLALGADRATLVGALREVLPNYAPSRRWARPEPALAPRVLRR